MRIEMKMPDLGTTTDEIKIVRWLVDAGQPVRRGQPILEVETDKAVMEVEAIANGVLSEILVAADAEAVTGDVIAVIEKDDS